MPILGVEELSMTKAQYKVFAALHPFFGVVTERIRGLVDGQHYFDTFAEDAIFESRYHFSGWPSMIRGRADLMASFSGYGKTIKLHSGDALVVRHSRESRHDSGIQSARQDCFEWRTLRQQVHFGDHD